MLAPLKQTGQQSSRRHYVHIISSFWLNLASLTVDMWVKISK
uniref:Uncharacterized protein n=1 Tax=Anguilla anguilla TaxID=7936 RepID=A0A0E9UBG3_ANGAN